MEINLKEKVISGVVWVFVDKVVNQLLPFVVYVYLASILVPSDFGLIGMLTVFTLFSKVLVDSGFSSGLIQKGIKSDEKDYSTVFYLNIFLAVVLYLVLYVASSSISEFYNEPRLVLLSRILFLTIIFDSLGIVPMTKLIIELEFRKITKVNILVNIISVVVTVYMVNCDYSYWSLVGLHVSRSILTPVLFFIISKWLPLFLISKETIKDLLSFSMKYTLSVFITRTLTNLNVLLIGRYFNSSQVGFFTQGQGYTDKVVMVLGSSLQSVTFPVLSSIKDDRDKMINVYKKIFKLTAFISIPVLFVLAAVSNSFVALFFDKDWLPVVNIIKYLAFAGALTPILWLNVSVLNANKRSDLFLKINIFKLPFNILILIVTIPSGIEAVALGQIIFSILSFFVNAYYPGKLYDFGVKEQIKIVFPVLICSIAMFLLLTSIALENELYNFLLKLILSVPLYLFLCYITMPTYIKENYNLIQKKWKK